EYSTAAAIPAALVAWHYAVQLSRPLWGHKSDQAVRRTPWIVGGLGILALGAVLAVDATIMMASPGIAAILLAIVSFTMIGFGV
ncbi:PucC family protein, partial [uncultured Algibacter sp.]|uniref:PucC family protein n=1 Tax=uncultured Algibacter sp. TaxID=298659 RepID=UPI00261ADA76